MPPILEVDNLVKKYGAFEAVRGLSFCVNEGEVFGLLGPNGAGKTQTISMATCLFPPTEGRIRIYGHDVVKEAGQVKRLIGIVPQDLALYPTLNARDNLTFFGQMFGLGGADLKQRVETVLQYVAMTDRANDAVKTYSGGMKRRINLAVGLIHSPRLLFLDEPTVGVDPQSRNHIFESVERLNREQGMTILYTSHYMEEVERLCHRVAIMERGQIIAQDTPKNLVAMLGGGIIHIGMLKADENVRLAVEKLDQVKSAAFMASMEPEADEDAAALKGRKTLLKVEARQQANDALVQVIQLFNEQNVPMLSVETLEPNLETVFLHLTGKSLRQ
jgi:ABC-2 type transport system ATP-binding protein